ncbi:MAG: LptA/OstA family protein [bacterium]
MPKLEFDYWKLIVVWFLLLGYCILPANAQSQDVTINGNNVTYSQDEEQVEATGSVEVVYQETRLVGEHVIYNTSAESVLADRGFTLHLEGYDVSGQTLDYDIKQQSGRASEVDFLFDRTIISGEKIELNKKYVKLNNAGFTTCDLEHPHYRVTANEIILYPKDGWLVASWGLVWIGGWPVFPLPTYIYDASGANSERRNILPFPKIGTNDEDGTYVSQELAWHLSRELSGSYTLSYFQKKGFGGGIKANYLLDDDNQGDFRLFANPTDQYYGGLTHTWSFGGEIEKKSLLGFNLFPKVKQFDLETTLSYHEWQNYERVSLYPKILIRANQGPLLGSSIKYDLTVGGAMISEVGTGKLGQGQGDLKLYGDLIKHPLASIVPFVEFDNRYYSDGTQWIRNSGGIGVERALTDQLVAGIGYVHYFTTAGTSPFNFELYRYNPADRLTSSLLYRFDHSGLSIDTSYFLDDWSPEDIDYSAFLSLHCYDLMLKYRSLRREFNVGLSFGG